jgi:hypothetical protein
MNERIPPDTRPYPPRSKMVDGYLAEIGRRLAAGDTGGAENAALLLPHLGVALASPELQSSSDLYANWCAQWVSPARERATFLEWCSRARSGIEGTQQGVPAEALRLFRLQRLVREIPAPTLSPGALTPIFGAEAEICEALLQAGRKWYAEAGRHDKVVQENLARLGVLR